VAAVAAVLKAHVETEAAVVIEEAEVTEAAEVTPGIIINM